jgi:hypothetical protein
MNETETKTKERKKEKHRVEHALSMAQCKALCPSLSCRFGLALLRNKKEAMSSRPETQAQPECSL